jgi:regulator of replication initiation timing
MNKSRKLNIFQRGFFQSALRGAVYVTSCILITFLLDWLEKIRFISYAEKAQKEGIINAKIAQSVKNIINMPDVWDFLLVIGVVFIGYVILRRLLRSTEMVNLSWPVTLPKAVEFLPAMRKIGKNDFVDQKDCLRKHDLRVYIATKPFYGDGEERANVKAKLYPSSYNSIYFLNSVLTTNIGERYLCLDADDYANIYNNYISSYKEYIQTENKTIYARIGELEEENKYLKAENDELKRGNAQLQEENAKYHEEDKMESLRDSKAEKERQSRVPFWKVALPLINRLLAVPEIKYARPEIQSEFEKELEEHTELIPAIKTILHTPKKEKEGNPFGLKGWPMERIREVLGDRAKTDGGRPETG